MDLDGDFLTWLGKKVLETDCEEAFERVALSELDKIGDKIRVYRTSDNLYGILNTFSNRNFPLTRKDGVFSNGVTNLQTLLFYEALEMDSSMKTFTFPEGRGGEVPLVSREMVELLEGYLVNKGLIKGDACVEYQQKSI